MQRGQPWQSWGTSEWSDQEWRKGHWREDQLQPHRSSDNPVIPTPSNFKEDTNLIGHLPRETHVEPSAWSRAKGIAGMDIKQITLPHLCRHGLGEFGLRQLSNGKFTGMVLTRTIAESVLPSQISQQLRDPNVDIDNTVDEWYGQHPPTKSTRPTSTSSPSWTPLPRPSSPSSSTAPPTKTPSKQPQTQLINYRNFKRKPPSTSKSTRTQAST